jgi:DNA-binding CsgD family transcriptional regulator/tetratricopeptide (TPR) repeat protein
VNTVGPLICPILVGRDDFLELADRRLAEARGGTGRLLLLVGEAGIGKTRLLESITRRAVAAGMVVVFGAVAPRDLEVPGGLFLDLARGMARTGPLRNAGRALGELLQGDAGTDADPDRRRRVLVLDAVDLLAGAGGTPIMLALEDLHWADELSLEILASLARRLPEVPVLVVATFRSDELYPRTPMREWRSRLVTQRLAEEARLARLSLEDTATMTNLLFDTALPAAKPVVERVHERTNGIPLHIEELLGALRGAPTSADLVGVPLSPEDAVSSAAVPDTIEGAVLERLRQRSAEAQGLARAGAVIGRCFVVDVAAGILGTDPARLSAPLEELTDHFFLVPAGPPGLYDFRHNLIRDAIYGRIADVDRRRMHARVAELGEGLPGAAEAFASAHFELAGRREEAFANALAGARAAAAMSSHGEAVQLYRRALRNIAPDIAPREHARILVEFAAEATATDDNAAAAEALATAEGLYRATGSVLDAAATLPAQAAARHLLGAPLDERAAMLRRGLGDLEDGTPDRDRTDVVRGRLLAALCAAYMLDRRLDESIGFGEAALGLASVGGDESTELNALITLGADYVFAGRMDDGWTALETGIRRAREARLEAEAARGYRMLGTSASVLVEYDRAERSLRDGIEYAERTERWNHRHYMAAHLAHVMWATGRWTEAVGVAEHALADGRGGITTRITALHVLGYVALGRGEIPAARRALDEALGLGREMHELQRISPAIWGLAELEFMAREPRRALGWCELGRVASAAVDDAAYLFPFLVTGTRANLALGDFAAAEHWVHEVGAALRRRSIPGTLPAIDHATGILLLAGGATGRARSSLEAASAGWSARGRIWEGTAVLVDLAGCHLRANRLAEAVRVAEQARATASDLPSPSLVARADEILRAGRARHPSDDPWAPLTAREFAVARLVAEGRTNAEIATELGIAPKTASAHVEHILAKLGAARRAEIGAWASSILAHTR